jgi:hypothetical protein
MDMRNDEQQPHGQGQPWGGDPARGRGNPSQYQVPPPAKKSKKKGCGLGCLGAIGVVVIIGIATAVAGGGKSSSINAAVPAPTTAGPAATTAAPARAAAAPATKAPVEQAAATSAAPTPDQVVFKCTGTTDGNGIDITYGPEGSDYSASSLPFSKTMTLDSSAQYYDVQAQLQGGGEVTCSTTVDWSGGPTVNQGTASGGYNIADAEVCSDFSDGWTTC